MLFCILIKYFLFRDESREFLNIKILYKWLNFSRGNNICNNYIFCWLVGCLVDEKRVIKNNFRISVFFFYWDLDIKLIKSGWVVMF